MKVEPVHAIEGPYGTAQKIGFEYEEDDDPRTSATIGVWFVYAPNQTPFWHHYLLSMVHLRDIPGVDEPAKKRFPSATHEVQLFALLPPPENKPVANDVTTWRAMTPYNLIEQVELPSDELAKNLLYHCAEAIVDGIVWAEPPLAGQREPWHTILIKTSAHLRGEEHAP